MTDLRPSRWAWLLLLILVGLGWGILCARLKTDWALNPQYHFGWAVPVLAGWLFYLRWTQRPLASSSSGRSVALGLLSIVLVLQFPLRLIEEANPEWRLALWVHALQMIGVTLCLLAALGGSPWVRYFLFPVAFMLISVPWPVPFEQWVIQGLMKWVAAITVEVVGWLGVPAMQHGNLIRIGSGLVGIDEACSGVRSLQTAIFVALFVGELHRFSASRRSLLILASLGVALFANSCRTVFLVTTASSQGMDRMHALHDTAGAVALWGTLGGLWLLASLMSRGSQKESAPKAASPGTGLLSPLPTTVLLAAIGWLLMVEVGTEAWYRSHEVAMVKNPSWRIRWPEDQIGFSDLAIADTTRSMLRFDEGRAVKWSDEGAHQWQLFWFRWPAGKNSAQLAKSHTPDICLRGAGYRLAEDLGLRSASAAGVQLPVRRYIFMQQERPLHVFYCLWEDRLSHGQVGLSEDGTQSSRLAAVFAGRRHLGQQVLEIAIEGPASAEEAWSVLERGLQRLVLRDQLASAARSE